MREFTNTTFTIQYPDFMAMAFDTIGINIKANSPSQNPTYDVTFVIEDAATSDTYTDSRTSYAGNMSIDIAPYVRAFMSKYLTDPFKADSDGYLPLSRAFNVAVRYGSTSILTFSFDAIWGTVNTGEKWNAPKAVKVWDGYPNTFGLFVGFGASYEGATCYRRGIITNQKPTSGQIAFAMTGVSPLSMCVLSSDNKTATFLSSPEVAVTLDNGEFGVEGNVLVIYGAGTIRMHIKAPRGWKVSNWTMYASSTAGHGYFSVANSKGQIWELNQFETVSCGNVDSAEDWVMFQETNNPTTGGDIGITDFYMTVAHTEDFTLSDASKIATAVNFLVYERTGRMNFVGVSNRTYITFEEKSDCGASIFLRWIDRGGFPVSWLFNRKQPEHKVKATDAMRDSMDGALIDNGVNGAVIAIDTKTKEVTLTAAYPLATEEEYNTLRTLLMSPVVEAWNEEKGYWYRVNIGDGTFSRSGAVRQDFEFVISLPAEEVQQL